LLWQLVPEVALEPVSEVGEVADEEQSDDGHKHPQLLLHGLRLQLMHSRHCCKGSRQVALNGSSEDRVEHKLAFDQLHKFLNPLRAQVKQIDSEKNDEDDGNDGKDDQQNQDDDVLNNVATSHVSELRAHILHGVAVFILRFLLFFKSRLLLLSGLLLPDERGLEEIVNFLLVKQLHVYNFVKAIEEGLDILRHLDLEQRECHDDLQGIENVPDLRERCAQEDVQGEKEPEAGREDVVCHLRHCLHCDQLFFCRNHLRKFPFNLWIEQAAVIVFLVRG